MLLHNVERFYYAEQFCDLILVCSDGNINCHKLMMASASLYLKTIFKTAPFTVNIIEFPGTSRLIFRHVLHYMYTGACHITSATVEGILDLSNTLLMANLIDHCSIFLEEHYCLKNVWKYHRLAVKYELDELKLQTTEFILSHLPQLYLQPDLILLSCEQLTELMVECQRQCNYGDVVLNCTMTWLENKAPCMEIRKKILEVIDYEQVSTECLIEVSYNNAVVH